MIHSTQALRKQFDKKEQQISNTNLEFNGASRSLFEELFRKNNEIIKLCINSFSEAAARLDQFDATFQRFKQELCRVGDTQNNFDFEFRRTHLEMQKKQTQLNNDISMLKNALEIQMRQASAQTYLNSDFFRQQSSKVMPRGKGRDFCHNRTKTNFSAAHPRFNLNKGQAACELQQKSVKSEMQEQPSLQNNQVQQTLIKKIPILRHVRTMIEQGIGEAFDQTLQNEQFKTKINELELRIQQCLRLMQNNKQSKQHLNLQEVYSQIKQKLSQQLESKVQMNYLQSSLQNLKQAWQTEENQIYLELQAKVDNNAFRQLVQRVSSLAESIEKLKKNDENEEKEVKVNTSHIKKSNNYIKNMLMSRPSSKQNLALSQIMVGDSLIRNQVQRSSIKNSLNFSNSLSAVKIGRNQRKHINIDSLRQLKESGNISQKAWRQRVNDLLGESKTIKRAKNCKK